MVLQSITMTKTSVMVLIIKMMMTMTMIILMTLFVILSKIRVLLGASKQLGTIIEGESLLNDGMAIVLYKIFFNLSFSSMTG